MGFFQNAWFVGISTGIISGILVFFLTKWIMDKRGKVEYYKQVNIANNNVINALKPYIADKGLPSIDIFEALVSSTARTFGIDEKDMFSVSVYCEELIREIISDVYVSNEKKQEYTRMLADYKKSIQGKKEIELEMNKSISLNGIYGERLKKRMSMYMAVLTSFIGVLCSVMVMLFEENSFSKSFWYPFEDNPIIWAMLVPMLVIVMMIMMLTTSEVMLKITKRKKQKDEEIVEKDKEV